MSCSRSTQDNSKQAHASVNPGSARRLQCAESPNSPQAVQHRHSLAVNMSSAASGHSVERRSSANNIFCLFYRDIVRNRRTMPVGSLNVLKLRGNTPWDPSTRTSLGCGTSQRLHFKYCLGLHELHEYSILIRYCDDQVFRVMLPAERGEYPKISSLHRISNMNFKLQSCTAATIYTSDSEMALRLSSQPKRPY